MFNKMEEIYKKALMEYRLAQTPEELFNAVDMFNSIIEYKDSELLRKQCMDKIRSARDEIYDAAVEQFNNANTPKDFEEVIKQFKKVEAHREAIDFIRRCNEKITGVTEHDEINKQIEYNKILSVLNIARTAKDYKKAAMMFRKMGIYRDCPQRYDSCMSTASRLSRKAAMWLVAFIIFVSVAICGVIYLLYLDKNKTSVIKVTDTNGAFVTGSDGKAVTVEPIQSILNNIIVNGKNPLGQDVLNELESQKND
jgi:hypothetical protein